MGAKFLRAGCQLDNSYFYLRFADANNPWFALE